MLCGLLYVLGRHRQNLLGIWWFLEKPVKKKKQGCEYSARFEVLVIAELFFMHCQQRSDFGLATTI